MGNTSASSFIVDPLEARRLMAFTDLVPAFAVGGTTALTRPAGDVFYEQADGKIVVSIEDSAAFNAPASLARLNADGTLDTAFSGDGIAQVGVDVVAAFAAAGGKTLGIYRLDDSFGTFRLNADGTLDTSYGAGGTSAAASGETYFDSDSTDYRVSARAAGPDGAIYLSLSDGRSTSSEVVIKFTPAGQLDTTWGTGGAVTLPGTRAGATFGRSVSTIIVREGNTVLLAGTEQRYVVGELGIDAPDYPSFSTYLTRLTSTGRPDTRFATAGDFLTPSSPRQLPPVTGAGLVRRADGHLLLAFTANGARQVFDFTANGKTSSPLATAAVNERSGVYDLELLPDGRLLTVSAKGLQTLTSTPSGLFLASTGKLPETPAGNAYSLFDVLPLRDGTLLASASYDTDSSDELINQFIKFSPGTASEPADNFIPFAQQASITATADTDSPAAVSVFYYDAQSQNLKYRARDASGRWGATEIVDATPFAGIYLSSNADTVAYTDGTNGDLKFAYKANGAWVSTTVDAAGSTGLYPTLVNGNIAYYNRTKGDLRLASHNSVDAPWTIQTLDSAGDVGRLPKVFDIDTNYLHDGADVELAIAYLTDNNRGVRLIERNTGRSDYTVTDVVTAPGGVGDLDLAYHQSASDLTYAVNTPTIAIYDAAQADLVIARRQEKDLPFKLVRAVTKGTVGLNPKVRNNDGGVIYYDRTAGQYRGVSLVFANDAAGTFTVKGGDSILRNAGKFSEVAYIPTGVGGGFFGQYGDGSVFARYDTTRGGLEILDGPIA